MKFLILFYFLISLITIEAEEISIPIKLTDKSQIGVTYSNSNSDNDLFILLGEKFSIFSESKNISNPEHKPILLNNIKVKELRTIILNILKNISPFNGFDIKSNESINIVIGNPGIITLNYHINEKDNSNLLELKKIFFNLKHGK